MVNQVSCNRRSGTPPLKGPDVVSALRRKLRTADEVGLY